MSDVEPMPFGDQSARGETMGADGGSGGRSQRGLDGTAEPSNRLLPKGNDRLQTGYNRIHSVASAMRFNE